jgi:serine phosphatase RsbU (regulator of sigma subunit)/putative methionine-R-sulfoxide reductase with GAF domain/anti-sigma regulatory factor (Ser/Thr protein kinase)
VSTDAQATSSREPPLRDPRPAALPSDRLLDELLARLCAVMSADVAHFLLIEDDQLRVLASHGVDPAMIAQARVPVGQGFAGTVAATASPAVLSDTSSVDSAFGAAWADDGVRALIGVPLVVDGDPIGVCVVGSRTDRTFGDDDITLLTAATERAAWAVQNGLLLAAERRARRTTESLTERLRRLEDISNSLVRASTVNDVVRVVIERGVSLIGAFAGALWEPDADAGALRLRGVAGYPDDVVERWSNLPLDAAAPAADAARTAQLVVVRSVAERDHRYPELAGRGSAGEAFVCAPLLVDHRVVGVLGLGFDRADHLDDDAVAFVEASVAQCTAAMHRALVVQAQQRSLAEARQVAARLQALQRVTAALADVRPGTDALDVLVREVTTATGAVKVALCVLDDDAGVLRTLRTTGLGGDVAAEYATFPYAAGLPAADALLQRRPVLIRTPAERDALYPNLARKDPIEHAWACLPLVIGDLPFGALALSLPGPHDFGPDDLEFLTALADQCTHALDRARLLAAETRSRQQLELLAEAGRVFAAPLDVQLTSMQFSRLVVGRIGDAVSVHLREPDGRYTLAAAEHVDPRHARAQRALSVALPAWVGDYYDGVLGQAQPVLVSDVPYDAFVASVENDDLRAILAERPPRSSVMLPLVAGGHALGILTVTTVDGGHPRLTAADVSQLEELAGRLALALDSARLLRQQTEISHTLQRSLLPSSLPQVPGAEVAVRYLPGAEGVDVGGDFYDVIPLPSGRIGLVVGDVMGRGVRAAAVMGQLRAAVRAYSLEGHSPAALLARLDRLVGTLEEGLLVTVLYAEWDPVRHTILCATAGHLPPLMRPPGGEPSYLHLDPGVPLGVGGHAYEENETTLPPGSLWLAFTDGLVEGPDLPVEDGMARLAAAMSSAAGAVDACDLALARLRPTRESGTYDDDTALLALATHPEDGDAPAPTWLEHSQSVELPADATSPGRARIFVADLLERWGLDGLIDSATLLTSELVTNAVRHAGTGMELAVSRTDDHTVRIAVTDRAPAVDVRVRSSGSDAEGGRGLFLVEQLATGWGSAVDDNAKTVWFELRA